MKILAVGGGSGGHVTPVVAVAKAIQQKVPNAKFLFVCDKKFARQARELFSDTNVKIKTISAGKLRRYANLKWYTYLTPYHIWHTHLANLADIFKIVRGFYQSARLLKKFRPDVVFIKGGYVSLPLGLAAARQHLPIVIHDSDVLPGLTNGALARYAAAIGTGSPIENYPAYPPTKTKFIGTPVDHQLFVALTKTEKREVLARLGFSDQYPLVVVTGGGGGSKTLNDLTLQSSSSFIKNQIQVLLLTGKTHTVPKHFEDRFFRIQEFSNSLTDIFRAANVVVTRAGASSLAELAAAKKAIVLVPHPHLAGNHQEKNSAIYESAAAAVVLNQRTLTAKKFFQTVSGLATNPERQKSLGQQLAQFAKPNALSDMANMILKVGSHDKKD
jgi:UDP-N-acetylglucosamine--N-acetylmuramyl-(pentapeptide) pyrophosphoryl-undecaprenol N-acetylglucosamine transferase